MKKFGLVLIMLGGAFASLGYNIYVKNHRYIEIGVKNTLIDSVNLKDYVTNRIELINNYKSRLDLIANNLDQEGLDIVINEINGLQDDVKEELISYYSDIENYIRLYSVKESLTGKVTTYTAFCSDGCHGYTASGRYVGNSVYYYDNDYGKVRIVAGDKSYPFGTIVRFNNLSYFGGEVYAIVLDRGGAIGKNRRALFDLLLETERSANDFGIARGVSCDILRLGY
jgi:3D (Asp-Asp-Asp) domain-containing protein